MFEKRVYSARRCLVKQTNNEENTVSYCYNSIICKCTARLRTCYARGLQRCCLYHHRRSYTIVQQQRHCVCRARVTHRTRHARNSLQHIANTVLLLRCATRVRYDNIGGVPYRDYDPDEQQQRNVHGDPLPVQVRGLDERLLETFFGAVELRAV